jgi:hypothetical protein
MAGEPLGGTGGLFSLCTTTTGFIVVHSVMQACRMHACMGRNGFLQVLQQGAAPEGAEWYEALLELLPSRS